MARPNSLTTVTRRLLADALLGVLEPKPPLGRAWCVGCALNRGATLDLASERVTDHLAQHVAVSSARVRLVSYGKTDAGG
jgi:hypothetical protein